MCQVVFLNIRNLYSGETDVAIRSVNCISICITVYVEFTRFSCFPSICVRCCETRPVYSLGQLSGIDEMNAGHLKLLGYEVVLLRLQPVPQF